MFLTTSLIPRAIAGVGGRLWLSLLIVTSLVAGAVPAQAQGAQGSQGALVAKEKARLLSRTATMLAKDGKYAEAAGLYEQSYALDPDPILLFNIGVVLEKTGDLPRASESLRRYVDLESDPALRQRGSDRLARLRAMIGALHLRLEPGGAQVSIDGRDIGATSETEVELAAGDHVVVARLEGYEEVSRLVAVPAGGRTLVAIELAPVPVTAPAILGAATDSMAAAEVRGGPADLMLWGGVALGSGLALVAGGGLLTWMAAGDRDEVTGARKAGGVTIGLSQQEAQALEDSANTKTRASWGLYGLGAAAAVTGITMMFMDGTPGEGEGGSVTMGLLAAPWSDGALVGLRGRF